jgi:hypothetical protein
VTTGLSFWARGLVYGVQSYETFLLKHWWVPVPKGLWYKFNGVDLRIPKNGLIDLMTGRFERAYIKADGPISGDYDYFNSYHRASYVSDGKDYIFLRNQRPVIADQFDYFKNWYYDTQEIDYIVQTANKTDTFQQPDILAIKNRTLSKGLVLPISKATSDANNRVVGEWYFSGDQWFESKNAPIHAGTFDKTKLTKLQQNICLVKPAPTQTYYVYLDPSAVGEAGESSGTSYGSGVMITTYYYYKADNMTYYFDGANWIPEKYTSLNTTELNENYTIIPDSMPYYTVPIEEDAYIGGRYHYGERITVPYVATQDNEWGYTGLGWIRLNSSTVSEIL